MWKIKPWNKQNKNQRMNRLTHHMKKLSLIILLVLSFDMDIKAQQFSHKAKLEKVTKDGFYTIQLTPDISAHAEAYMQDLRLFDNDGKEVPYLYRKQSTYQSNDDFVSYAILENEEKGDWQTLIIENGEVTQIDQFLLLLNNAETDRVVRLSGSNDRATWYVIRDSFYLSLVGAGNEATVRAQLTFPMSKYQYYKLEIKKKENNPLKITQVGYNKKGYKSPLYQKVNGLTFSRRDSAKKTFLNLVLPRANRVDKLVFHISGPGMYNRIGRVFKFMEEVNSYTSHSVSKYSPSKRSNAIDAMEFELNSDREPSVYTQDFIGFTKLDTIELEINNNDNEPLKIDSITAFQLSASLTAELREGKTYFLYFGDSLLQAPNYDIHYFESKIVPDSQMVFVGPVQPKDKKVKDEYNQSNDKLFVWIGIGIVAILLIFMTKGMMKNMKNLDDIEK